MVIFLEEAVDVAIFEVYCGGRCEQAVMRPHRPLQIDTCHFRRLHKHHPQTFGGLYVNPTPWRDSW